MVAERVIAGLSCGDVLAGLADYLDGELSPEALVAVRAHVAECSECARFGGAYAKVVESLRRTPQAAPLDDDAVASIVASAAR